MKVIKEPDKIQHCVFEVKESDSGAGYYWDGAMASELVDIMKAALETDTVLRQRLGWE